MERLTTKIMIGLILGLILGGVLHHLPASPWRDQYLLVALKWLGQLFISIIRYMVIPVVFFSLAAGVCSIGQGSKLGLMALKTILLYLITTCLAIILALSIASLFGIGKSQVAMTTAAHLTTQPNISLSQNLKNVFLGNPLYAFTGKNMIQLIIFAIIFALIIRFFNKNLKKLEEFVVRTNDIIMIAIMWLMLAAPYGVFCLVSVVFAKQGFGLIGQLAGYFFTVLFVLAVQWIGVYGTLLKLLTHRKVFDFYKNMRSAFVFAFSVSSSNASIPITLETCEKKLGIRNQTAAFVIPLGATINMDGTAVMQGVATVFVAHLYGITLGLNGYLMVIITATLASIGAAGVPSVGLITLAMVFRQAGLPMEGIAIILGIDRLLDMARTAVNITGDCVVACIIDQPRRVSLTRR
jgi:Na+/H+-dicarboxylate symporter